MLSAHEGHVNSKPTGLRIVETSEKEFDISREEIINVSEKDSAFAAAPLELRTVLHILQESYQLVQKKRPHVASSTQKTRNDEERPHEALREASIKGICLQVNSSRDGEVSGDEEDDPK